MNGGGNMDIKQMIQVLDDYLVDYAVPVDWVKFRETLREIRDVLVNPVGTEEDGRHYMICPKCGKYTRTKWHFKSKDTDLMVCVRCHLSKKLSP